MDEYIGTIQPFGFDFVPRGWAVCNGQLIAINQNQALFSLLGTIYGGDGVTTFALPDLRGMTPIGQGFGPGLSNKQIGQKAGNETNMLQENQLPRHAHAVIFNEENVYTDVKVPATNNEGTLEESDDAILANRSGGYANPGSKDSVLLPFSAVISGTMQSDVIGNSEQINNMQPYLAVNFCICMQGIYPSRN